jgi:hypothetical protein
MKEEERGSSRGKEGSVVAGRSQEGPRSAPKLEEDEVEHAVRDGTVTRMTKGGGSGLAPEETPTPFWAWLRAYGWPVGA